MPGPGEIERERVFQMYLEFCANNFIALNANVAALGKIIHVISQRVISFSHLLKDLF